MLIVNPKKHCPNCNGKPIEIRDHGSYIAWDFCNECSLYYNAQILTEKQRIKKDEFNRKYGEVYLTEKRHAKRYDLAIL